jgi:hypothetical protein
VPQSVCNKDGQAQDVDIVVNEMFEDGDEVLVEYSNGPTPYKVRCGTLQQHWICPSNSLPPHAPVCMQMGGTSPHASLQVG